ncbi:YtxH domain-containing protein [Hymenobacter sp. GOD-10R]|uniref:YtxH domain-containing protein n=1 Tax=Hymenobacter sp. GOD-10R TaxID=3093922 RepID=UPI002D785638|nr:YtxH domain-containing protein [Hymenobacter sp. GOD-10R]WRQ27375.1 YtxH domain-containing protein [Hymenobacter sp. GOD-10R]
MKDNNGKIILSLLVGATAGAVAGLLLAPETGEGTRASLKQSADKLGNDLGKLFKQGVSRFNELTGKDNTDVVSRDSADANNALNSLYRTGKSSITEEGRKSASVDYAAGIESVPSTYDDFDSDYDGSAGEGRHMGSGLGQTF